MYCSVSRTLEFSLQRRLIISDDFEKPSLDRPFYFAHASAFRADEHENCRHSREDPVGSTMRALGATEHVGFGKFQHCSFDFADRYHLDHGRALIAEDCRRLSADLHHQTATAVGTVGGFVRHDGEVVQVHISMRGMEAQLHFPDNSTAGRRHTSQGNASVLPFRAVSIECWPLSPFAQAVS